MARVEEPKDGAREQRLRRFQERDLRILELWNAGKTLREIGAELQVCPDRVRAIIRRHAPAPVEQTCLLCGREFLIRKSTHHLLFCYKCRRYTQSHPKVTDLLIRSNKTLIALINRLVDEKWIDPAAAESPAFTKTFNAQIRLLKQVDKLKRATPGEGYRDPDALPYKQGLSDEQQRELLARRASRASTTPMSK